MPEAQKRHLSVAYERPTPVAPPIVAPPPVAVPKSRVRDRRIDVFRGLALAMIYINHVPGTIYENLTSRNFGFSDAAEMFVFISGTSAALAYGDALGKARLWPGVSRIWGRAWTLYMVHVLITVWVIAIAAATSRLGGDDTLMATDNVQFLRKDMTGVLTGLPLMTHQLGYVNILPMYTVLLLACPFLILSGRRFPRATACGSVGLWLAAGLFGLDLPNFPLPGGWFLNPIAWQLLFVLGLLTGLALRNRERFVPRHPALIALAAGILLVSLVWVRWPAFADMGNSFMARLAALGLPPLVRDFDKTYLSVPRLLHALALIYLISALPWVKRLCDSRWSEPLALLGRQALAVFALGTVLSFGARAALALGQDTFLFDSAVIFAGIALMWFFALALERGRAAARAPA